MTTLPEDVLRPLVTDAVRDALAELRHQQRPSADTGSATPSRPVSPGTGSRVETVRLTDDRDLAAFVRRIVALCDNPRTRAQLVAGQLRFTLGPTQPTQPGAPAGKAGAPRSGHGPAHRVDRGAVTERVVVQAAERGQRLLLGRRAVLTPLARDRARTLGVAVEKER